MDCLEESPTELNIKIFSSYEYLSRSLLGTRLLHKRRSQTPWKMSENETRKHNHGKSIFPSARLEKENAACRKCDSKPAVSGRIFIHFHHARHRLRVGQGSMALLWGSRCNLCEVFWHNRMVARDWKVWDLAFGDLDSYHKPHCDIGLASARTGSCSVSK